MYYMLDLKEAPNSISCLSTRDKSNLILLYQTWQKRIQAVGQNFRQDFHVNIWWIGRKLAQEEWSLSGLGIITMLAIGKLSE